MSSTIGSSAASDPPVDPAPSSPTAAQSTSSPNRPVGPGAAGADDPPEGATSSTHPRFPSPSPTSTDDPATTSAIPVATTSAPPAPVRTTTTTTMATTTSPRPTAATATSSDAPDRAPTTSNDPAPAAVQDPPAQTEPASPATPLTPLGPGSIVAGSPTVLAVAIPTDPTSIAVPTTLADGSTTTVFNLAPQPVLLTPSSTQGFVTSVRDRSGLATDAASATSTGDAINPGSDDPRHPTLTQAEKRQNSSATITGIALGALVVILLSLVLIPKLFRMRKAKKERKEEQEQWKVGKKGERGIGYVKGGKVFRGGGESTADLRQKDADEISWFSGSTADGGLSDDGTESEGKSAVRMRMRPTDGSNDDVGSFHLVQTLPYNPNRSRDNLAGIGRRDTLRSIVRVPNDVPPPQAEFVAMPRTPTIVYSPPPEDSDLAVFRSSDEPPHRNLTPLSFPTTPTSFPSTPNNPFSTPPLSGLYSASEWQHILATPPETTAPSPTPPPEAHVQPFPSSASRTSRRSTLPPSVFNSPNLSHLDSAHDTDSIYSSHRSSFPSPNPQAEFVQPSTNQLLENVRNQQRREQENDQTTETLDRRMTARSESSSVFPVEVRLEGLAKAAARYGGGGGIDPVADRGGAALQDGQFDDDDREEVVFARR
ncbi:hypothetical protein JCM10212_000313 [Sporobolomyces blumeae]